LIATDALGEDERAVERKADLTSVGMSGQNQVVTPTIEPIVLDRIMNEQNTARGFGFAEDVDATQSHPYQFEIMLLHYDTAIHQPRAASRSEGLLVFLEIGAAVVIPIARASIDGPRNLPDEVEGGRRKASVFYQIARETDKLRRKRVDRAHNFGRLAGVALVVRIAEVHKTAGRL